MPTGQPRVSVTVSPGLRAAARRHAEARCISLSELIAEALAAHLAQASNLALAPGLDPTSAPNATAHEADIRTLMASNAALIEAIREVLPSMMEAAQGYRELQLQVDDVTVALGRRAAA